jgi:hypothetical protein
MRFARTTNVARETFIGAGIVLNENCREKLKRISYSIYRISWHRDFVVISFTIIIRKSKVRK